MNESNWPAPTAEDVPRSDPAFVERAAGGDARMTGPVYDTEDVHDDGERWDDEERDRD
ncbi:hypothetical protein ACP6C7_03785 [Mycolicibacterium septicum]|uniref:Uncharacterized protein n=1 Tax=Mycolicibacterium septicum TaxID=98668 RepID=A0ABW9LNN7_9MYCO